jgi:hypothetical protein
MSNEIHISINRGRLLFQTILFSFLGVGALLCCFSLAEVGLINPIIWQGLGAVLCLVLIVTAGSKAKKRADKNAGITITKEGIHDKSSAISLGLIRWSDIKEIDKEVSLKSKLLVVRVKKNSVYLKKANNSAIERLLRQNIRNFDTPVVIESKYLESSLEELLDILLERFNR